MGLMHRDIKPSNILICERGGLHDTAKLLDFGIVLDQGVSADGEKLTREGAIPGTPAYMSPEQAGGEVNLDPRSDIYSLGAVAYFLLTGQSRMALSNAIVRRNFFFWCHLWQICYGCVIRRPWRTLSVHTGACV